MHISPETLLLIAMWIAIVACSLVLYGVLFRKAGYSFWRCLIMLVPVVNLIWLLVFLAKPWPIERELDRMRRKYGRLEADDWIALDSESDVLAKAAKLEQAGNWKDALNIYERLASDQSNPNASYADNCAKRLRARLRTVAE